MGLKTYWGTTLDGLKHEYKNEHTGEVKVLKVSDEELKKYLDDLDRKNKYKIPRR